VLLGFTHATTNFNHIIIDGEPSPPVVCCLDVITTGDLDGDGFVDVIVGSEHSVGLVWYHYPSWRKYSIGAGDFTTDAESFDVDRDGDVDILISAVSRDEIEWWENTGTPFQESGWVRHPIGQYNAHDLEAGDLNGDGRTDIVMFRKENPKQLTWFECPSDPRERWPARVIDSLPGEGLAIGDIDGDGDQDISASSRWYENKTGDGTTWLAHQITTNWGASCRSVISDMNGDGLMDVVLSHSEGKGRVSWFENPSWAEHEIEGDILEGAHSLEVGDLDGDGDPDVVTGEMHTSTQKRVLAYENLGSGKTWNRVLLSTSGTHNACLADVGSDGDLDIVGKNYDGPKVVEMWENTSADWTYIQVDDTRPAKAFGLAFGDLTGDGYRDIVSGPFFYRNPGGDMTGTWTRTAFPLDVDAMLVTDVDGDGFGDVIAEKLPNVYWLEAADTQCSSWSSVVVGTIPPTEHGNGQGYMLAQIVAGGKPEIVLASGEGLFYFEIPANPATGSWPRVQITGQSSEEGLGAGDLDHDGDIDVCAGVGENLVAWWENPGSKAGNWAKHEIGSASPYPDRFAMADINQDGRLDIVVSEERNGAATDANVYWFEQPVVPQSSDWIRHTIVTQYTTNSMDVADLDGDGDSDVITAEHRGTKKLACFKNDGLGKWWTEDVISRGMESHLGARTVDLDGDGDLEIISIAWDEFKFLHLWRNNSRRPRSANTGTAVPGSDSHKLHTQPQSK
jgi:hypothetical protein